MAKQRKRRGTPPPKDETKEQRFVRVCILRVNKALKSIKNIGNCAGASYSSTPEQVDGMFVTLNKMLEATKEKFTKQGTEETAFKFGESV